MYFFLYFLTLLTVSASVWAQISSPSLQKIKNLNRLEIAALQIALDKEGFSPGVIDGHFGSKATMALNIAQENGRKIEIPSEPWRTWEIPVDFLKDIAPVPDGWLSRSKLLALGYERVQEKIAERFHVSENFLAVLNPQIKDWKELKEGNSIKVPSLILRRLPQADYLSISLKNKLIVALNAQKISLASFPCSIAAKEEKRPIGKLEVCVLAANPDYLFDPKLFPEVLEAATLKTKLMIPPGPNNPVGEIWIGLNLKGYGIHGTPLPEDIGKTESHGCFRLSNWDAKRLATMLRIGTPVFIEE